MLVQHPSVTFGTDPEFFLTNENGEIVGSELVIPEGGTDVAPLCKAIRDGVQVEINMGAFICRQEFTQALRNSILGTHDFVLKNNKDLHVSFISGGELSETEFDKLSPTSKQFGCAPSENAYNDKATVGVDGRTYKFRAAGGHIHMGNLPKTIYYKFDVHGRYGVGKEEQDHRTRLVPILDALVGNTCVLIDRDPIQAIRRQHYGRAGEHRLPKHGLEYRTLSNFWTKAYPLVSLVLGLTRLGVAVLDTTLSGKKDLEKDLLENIDFDTMIKAINTNDAELAQKNWEVVKRFISQIDRGHRLDNTLHSLDRLSISYFDNFVKDVQARGIEEVFNIRNQMDYWSNCAPLSGSDGWERWFDRNYVRR